MNLDSILRGWLKILNPSKRARIRLREMSMRAKAHLVGAIVLAELPLAAAQTRVPKDPGLIDAQSHRRILQQYEGKPLLVTFRATWCELCRDEYPVLNELAKQYAPNGLQVVGGNLD